MESTISFSSFTLPSSFKSSLDQKPRFQLKGPQLTTKPDVISCFSPNGGSTGSVRKMHVCRSGYHTSFCYDKSIPEEIIEKPVALSERSIGDSVRCNSCEAKGALNCATCAGSGLYIDSIMESQGIIVKVRCLGCFGTGNIMCSQCGGVGHL